MDVNDNLPSNSHRTRTTVPETSTKKKPVIAKGKATVKKKTFVNKLCDTFMVDNISDIKSTIVNDFLIPGCKELIHNSIINAVDLLFGGDISYNRNRSNTSNRPSTSYMNKPVRSYDRQYSRNNYNSRNRSIDDYAELEFADRGSATMVLNEMYAQLDEYKFVTVATMYDLAAISTNNNWMLDNYGWTDISSATIKPIKNGWLLSMPKPMQID